MKSVLILFVSLISYSAKAQRTLTLKDPNAQERLLSSDFHAIQVSAGIDLILDQADKAQVAVSYSDEKYADKFKTVVEDGVLKIYLDADAVNWGSNQKRQLKAYVSFVTLDKLDVSAGATVKLPLLVTVSELDIRLTSGSDFNGAIHAEKLMIEATSGAVMEISGKTGFLDVSVNSGASFKGYELEALTCDAKATSGGRIKVNIGQEMNARANSGGSINYKGNGVVKDINVNSGGVVKKSS
jgi:hypothetical protein